MSKEKEISFIRKGIAAIAKGDARAMKKNIKEALFLKIREKLNQREKELAKSYLSNIETKKD